MPSSLIRLLECAINAAREAANGRTDIETAERVYRGARKAGVPRDALAPARKHLGAARRAEARAVLA